MKKIMIALVVATLLLTRCSQQSIQKGPFHNFYTKMFFATFHKLEDDLNEIEQSAHLIDTLDMELLFTLYNADNDFLFILRRTILCGTKFRQCRLMH